MSGQWEVGQNIALVRLYRFANDKICSFDSLIIFRAWTIVLALG